MPFRPAHPCNHHGCAALTHERFCPDHASEYAKQTEQARPGSRERGYSSAWTRYAKAFLARHPLCVNFAHCHNPATCVDHIAPHTGNKYLFWLHENHQAMCAACHGRKTCREDGGYGNARRTA